MLKLKNPFQNATQDKSFYRLFDDITHLMDEYTASEFEEKSTGLLKNPKFLAYLDANPVVTMIMDFQRKGYFYISENMKEILGYDREDFYTYGLQKTLTVFPLEQSEIIVHKIFPRMFEYFDKHALSADAEDLRVSFPSKIIHGDGTVGWYLHQIKILHSNEQHKPLVGLKIITDITDYKKDEVLTLKISKKDETGVFKTIFTEHFFGFTAYAVSDREKEILLLLDEGKSSLEISEILFISMHTVNTHRRNILKKMEATSTIDLLRKAAVNGII